MFDIKDTAARLGDDIARRARPLGRDIADRTRPYSDDLIGRAEDLLRRAAPYGRDLMGRARSYADDTGGRAEALARRVRGRTATVIEPEPRSFLSSPGGQAAGAAALGLLAGLAFGVVRKAGVQGAEALAGDWLEILKAEHKAVDALFEQMLATSDSQKIKRTLLLAKISRALTKHAMQEEMVIYPALKESSGDGRAMDLYADHATVKIFIHELNDIHKDDPQWIVRARAFREAVAQHVREEEDEVFPAYHARMSPQQNRRLTLLVHREGLKLA